MPCALRREGDVVARGCAERSGCFSSGGGCSVRLRTRAGVLLEPVADGRIERASGVSVLCV